MALTQRVSVGFCYMAKEIHMKITILLLLIIILDMAFFILAGCALLPAKFVMRTMPKELQEATKNTPNPPRWKIKLGYKILVICIVIYIGVMIYAGLDGRENGFSYWMFFVRYMIIFYGFKAFDIICLDWFLITKTQFFQYFFPETRGSSGYNSFGFNKKEQITRICIFPFICAVLAGICTY